MIVANSGGNNVLVYLGLGLGQFAAPRTFYAGTNPVDVQVADVNGDGRPDVIVTNQGSNDVSILLGDQLALLRPGPRLDVGLAPVGTQIVPSQTAGGLPSLLVTNSGSNNVFMLPALGGGFFNDAAPTVFNTGLSPQAAIVGNFFGAGLDLVTLNYLSNTLTVYRGFDPASRHDIGSGGLGPITAIAGDFAANGGLELVVGNNGNGTLAIFTATANGLIESDAIFSETLQHPIALALAAPGEGQELRLLAADEGDENVRVFTRESVLQPVKLADGDLSSGGMPGFSFGVGGISVLFGILGGLVESSAGELFAGLETGTSAGGASMNLPSFRDFSIDQLTAAVSRGTKWIESAFGTIFSSAGVHGMPEAAVDVLESVLDVAAPQVPWQALHHFFNSLLRTSAQNQKGSPKPDVVNQTLDTTSVDPRNDAAAVSILFDGDDSQAQGKQFDEPGDLLADLADWMTGRTEGQIATNDLSVRQRLFELAANPESDYWLPRHGSPALWSTGKHDRSLPTDDEALPTASADSRPIDSARAERSSTERRSTERDSVFAQWLLPGAIASVLTNGSSLFGGRESTRNETRGVDRFLDRKRRLFN
jgi:hypothetical protein